ncbi:MAG: hypothetical protein PWQ27_1571 [Kosmotoga sp.]|nr:hypothetical protein [Kosmotoga sp.]
MTSETDDKGGLRRCQLGAYWATMAHFTYSDEAALICMPTGSGKTAVMMLLAFGLKASRILIVSPSSLLRSELAERFKELRDLERAKVIGKDQLDLSKLTVKSIDHMMTTEKWAELQNKEDLICISTPKTITKTKKSKAVYPPENFFDLVFFDEAHHLPATTWGNLFRHLGSSKKVLLTATPYRTDKKPIPGVLVYSFPVEKAIEDKILRRIALKKAETRGNNKDERIANTVKDEFLEMKKMGYHQNCLSEPKELRTAITLKSFIKKYSLKSKDSR